MMGLGPGTYVAPASTRWLGQIPVYSTVPEQCTAVPVKPNPVAVPVPPPAGGEALPEAPPEGPAGSTLPGAFFYAIWLYYYGGP